MINFDAFWTWKMKASRHHDSSRIEFFSDVRQPDHAAEEKCDQPQARQPNFHDFSTRLSPMNLGKAIVGGFKYIFSFSPRTLGKWSNLTLTSIFFKGSIRGTLLGTITYPWNIIDSKTAFKRGYVSSLEGKSQTKNCGTGTAESLCFCHVHKILFKWQM